MNIKHVNPFAEKQERFHFCLNCERCFYELKTDNATFVRYLDALPDNLAEDLDISTCRECSQPLAFHRNSPERLAALVVASFLGAIAAVGVVIVVVANL